MIMYIYHVLINVLSTHMVHIDLNTKLVLGFQHLVNHRGSSQDAQSLFTSHMTGSGG